MKLSDLGLVNLGLRESGCKFTWTLPNTVCPKVCDTLDTTLFSGLCGWILKPFDLMIAHTGGFVLVYDNACYM